MANHRDPVRRPLIVMTAVLGYDLLAAAAAMYAAIELRFAVAPVARVPAGLTLSVTLLFLASCAIIFPLQGLHRGVWRFTAFNDTLKIVYATVLANLLFLMALFVFTRLDGFPRSAIFIEGPILIALLAGARYIRQMTASGDWRSLLRFEDRSTPAAVLVGRHEALDAFLRDVARRRNPPTFRARALAEPNGVDIGRLIRGVPVIGGAEEAKRALMSLSSAGREPPQMVIVDPSLTRDEVNEFAGAATEAGAALVRARNIDDRTSLSPLDAADLLSRPPRQLDPSAVRAFIEGRRILVTGAGGTIGSELTRQIARANPAELTLLDSSEYNLYEIDRELSEAGLSDNVESLLGDVRDPVRIASVMSLSRPQVVLHAAALKHVPLMERNPIEAVLTNVAGTVTVAQAAKEAGAEVFVLISTDKAVNPTNVMGASKRAAEMFVQALDADPHGMRAVAVRFGNVLGSAGSVVPLFERQIRAGGPLTVTHPDMTRYFMTVQEAAALVLQAAGLGSAAKVNGGGSQPGGGLFALDMGEPVRIEHLARELCKLRGVDPDRDIEIVHVGLRPGEKVHEDLFYVDEVIAPTEIEGVWRASAPYTPMAELLPRLEALTDAARRRDHAALFRALGELAPEFQLDHPAGEPASAP